MFKMSVECENPSYGDLGIEVEFEYPFRYVRLILQKQNLKKVRRTLFHGNVFYFCKKIISSRKFYNNKIIFSLRKHEFVIFFLKSW